MKIAIVYSLPTKRLLTTPYGATDEDSSTIAEAVRLGLCTKGHDVEMISLAEDNIAEIAKIEAECVFNLIEWCGLDIDLSKQAFRYLRALQIPVTGSSEELFVLTGDKARVKQMLEKLGAPTPRGQVFVTWQEKIRLDLSYPVIVKPALEHCSVGLSKEVIARNQDDLTEIVQRQLAKFGQSVVAEEFVVGRELLVYLLETEGGVMVLPIEEVVFHDHDPLSFQTYESKWEEDHPDYVGSEVVMAKLSPGEQKIIESESIRVFREMGLAGYARFDVRLRGKTPYILETNANPSVYDADWELSDPYEEIITGIKFADYLETIVQAAVRRYREGWRV